MLHQLKILRFFINQKVYQNHILYIIRKKAIDNPPKVLLNTNLLWRYIVYIVSSGIVQLPQEWLYFIKRKAFENWMLKIPFLSRVELQQSKHYFTGTRPVLTEILSNTAFSIWNPSSK